MKCVGFCIQICVQGGGGMIMDVFDEEAKQRGIVV
jgi:hypothetical protein